MYILPDLYISTSFSDPTLKTLDMLCYIGRIRWFLYSILGSFPFFNPECFAGTANAGNHVSVSRETVILAKDVDLAKD